jgi:hypothetical protein
MTPLKSQTKETAAADPANLRRNECFPLNAKTTIARDNPTFNHINAGS